MRLVQPILDLPGHLILLTSNIESINDSKFEPRFRDRLAIERKMSMDPMLMDKILDRELNEHAAGLIVPPPIRQSLLQTGRSSIREMQRVLIVSARRSREDNFNILFIYPISEEC